MAESAEAKHTKRKDPKVDKNKDRNKADQRFHKVKSESRSKVSQVLKQYQAGAISEEELEMELEESYGEDGSFQD
jgi:hypothetical protein